MFLPFKSLSSKIVGNMIQYESHNITVMKFQRQETSLSMFCVINLKNHKAKPIVRIIKLLRDNKFAK